MSEHTGEMTALWYNAPRDFEVKQIPIPEIKEDVVLLKVNLCGFCGTDVRDFLLPCLQETRGAIRADE
jgi:D-arabinitol dehydrogenase (NADP+)